MDLPPVFCITLRRTEARWLKEKAHLESVGINAKPFYGVDGQEWRLVTPHNYEVDHPNSGFNISKSKSGVVDSKLVALILSHVTLWTILQWMEDDYFMILEDDAKFPYDWREQFDLAIRSVPDDWDVLYTGSCCAGGKPATHKAGNVFEIHFPLCTHSYLVKRRAIPFLLEGCKKIYAPLDIAMANHTFPHLRVYTVMPRIAEQWDTLIPI